MSGDRIGPSRKDRAAELLVEGVRLAGSAESAHRAALFKMKHSEPIGDERSRFGSRMIDDIAIRHREELVGLGETASGNERGNAVAKKHPLLPGFFGRRNCGGAQR